MSLLDDLTLGRDRFEEEEPFDLRGAGPVQGYPLASPQAPMSPIMPDATPDPSMGQEYGDLKAFDSDITRAKSIASDYNTLSEGKKRALTDFEDTRMRAFWESNFRGYEGVEGSAPSFKTRGAREPADWFKGFEENMLFQGEKPGVAREFAQLKKKHGNLYADFQRAERVHSKAQFRVDAMNEAYLSVPEHVRRASENWKEENPGKDLSDSAFNTLLDNTQFEEARYDPYGKLLNPNRVDPRKKLDVSRVNPYTQEPLSKRDQEKQDKRLASARKHGLQALKSNFSEAKMARGLKKHGWLYSKLAQVAGKSILLDEKEREILTLADARDGGYVKFIHGRPVDDVLATMGGKDKENVARVINNVGNAHAEYQRVALAYANNWKKEGYEQASEVYDLAKKKWEATVHVAEQYGLTDRLALSGKSSSYLDDLFNAAKSGFKQEDTTEIVPGLLTGGVERSDAVEFIENMKQLAEMPQSESLKEYAKLESDGMLDAAKNFVLNLDAFPELFVNVMAAYGNTYVDNAVPMVGTGLGLGLLKGGPRGAAKGGMLALKANIGVTSFVLEYASKFMAEFDKRGIDWQNPDVFMAAMSNDALMDEIRFGTPFLSSATIALFDQGYAMIAGKTAQLVKRPAALKKVPGGVTAFNSELNAGVQASIR